MSTRILIMFIVSLNPQSKEQGDMTTVRVRYMVNDLDPMREPSLLV